MALSKAASTLFWVTAKDATWMYPLAVSNGCLMVATVSWPRVDRRCEEVWSVSYMKMLLDCRLNCKGPVRSPSNHEQPPLDFARRASSVFFTQSNNNTSVAIPVQLRPCFSFVPRYSRISSFYWIVAQDSEQVD